MSIGMKACYFPFWTNEKDFAFQYKNGRFSDSGCPDRAII